MAGTFSYSPAAGTVLTEGSHTITATFTPTDTTDYASATSSVSISVTQATPAIIWSAPASIAYGTALSATQLNASSTVAGTFSYSPAAGTVLTAGNHTITATFTPTDTTDYTTATATVTLNVIPAIPVITLLTSANPVFMTYAVSFTASLPPYASTQTGTMAFFDGATQIGVATIAGGSATITTTGLAAGAHSITAAYSGDSNYGPGSSSTLTENIQDFTLTFAEGASGTASVPAGGRADYRLVITPVGGATLPAGVTLAVPNVPAGMATIFSPATLAAGSGTATVTLEVTLPEASAVERSRGPLGGGALPVALGLILLPFAGGMSRRRAGLTRLVAVAALSAALAVGMMGCGAKLSAENFSLTVTAASGSLSHSVTAQLTVK